MPTALVVGATGLVGREVVAQLTDDAHFDRVIVLARKAPAAPPAQKVDWRVIDFDADAPYAALQGVSAIFCCLGTTQKQTPDPAQYHKIDHDYPVRVAAACPDAVYCLVSAVGADARSRVPYNRLKGETEADVQKHARTLHIFRPSFLLGERGGRRIGEAIGIAAFKAVSPLFLGPLSRYHSIRAEVLAAGMIRLAKDPTPGAHLHHYSDIVS
jgi:uncharacterized protein YbjT (DUF2867 family)